MVDQLGEQYFTTDGCVELVVSNKDYQYRNDDSVSDSQRLLIEKFEKGKLAWMDKTYVPVFGSHLYDYTGHPVLTSKDNSAVLVKKVSGDREKIWINKEMAHDHDIKLFMSSSLPSLNLSLPSPPTELIPTHLFCSLCSGPHTFILYL